MGQLADQEFQFLQAGECGWIMTDSSYQTAHVTYTTAVTTLATARTTYALSVTANADAVTEAARLKLECECATQSTHAVAWADANADNDANAAAWAQAHHIDCVVDHIAEADCSFGPAPGLTQPTLCDDIESVSCAAESGSAQHVPADEEPVYIDPCPLGMPNCGEQEAIATPTEGRTGSNGNDYTYSSTSNTNVAGGCSSAPGGLSDNGSCSSDANCQEMCNADSSCLGYIDMSARGWGYMTKNYVSGCFEHNRYGGFVLRVKLAQ